MLKQFRLTGFDTRPDLYTHFEALASDIEREVGRWANRVEAILELRHPESDRPFIWLTLSLTLPHSAAADSAVGALADVQEPSVFRKWVRFVWGSVLDKLIEQRAGREKLELAPAAGGV
jgi:hypothetical protein